MRPLHADDPAVIGDYRILGRLGAGGMGRVYLARSRGGRTVAVKVIRSEHADDPAFRQRFHREVGAARRVTGPWTAPVLDADPEGHRPYLVTAYIPGPSLAEAIGQHGPLPAATIRALAAGLAEALVAIHGAGLVHRDLKPSNVLLSVGGPRVIDFGIARALDAATLTRSGAAIGSPAYMSPEQINGAESRPASDVFALGATLVYAAAGAGPFDGPTIPAALHNVLTREPGLDVVPADLRPLLRACLSKTVEGRPSPAEVLAAVAPAGAAALVTGDWLPPGVLANLSRRAVALLDLDAPAMPDAAEAARYTAGGATGFGPGATPPAATTNLLASSDPVSVARSTPGAESTPGAAGTPRVPSVPSVPRSAGAPPATPGSTPSMPPRTAMPMPVPPPVPAATGLAPQRGRALVAALAAAAVSVLLIVVLVVILVVRSGSRGGPGALGATMPGAPGVGTSATASLAPTTPPAATVSTVTATLGASAGSGGVVAGALPAGYAGTWTGKVTSELGVVQTLVLTLRAGRSGQTLGHTVYTVSGLTDDDGQPLRCVGDQTFTGLRGSGAAARVVLQDNPSTTAGPDLLGVPACTSGGTTLLGLRSNGQLSVQVEGAGSGQPTGELTRSS